MSGAREMSKFADRSFEGRDKEQEKNAFLRSKDVQKKKKNKFYKNGWK